MALRFTPFKGQHPFNLGLLNDLDWFLQFAQSFKSVVLLPSKPRQEWVIKCDSMLDAAGAFSQSEFYAVKFPTDLLARKWNDENDL